MHGAMFGGFGWIGMILGLLFWLLIFGGLVVLVVWAVRRSNSGHMPSGGAALPAQSAKDIAQLRYARGEITREQYQQLVEDLNR